MITKVDIPPDDRHEYTGLSTDTKPLAGDGSLFYELDTEDVYYAMFGNWWKVGTKATPPVPSVTVRVYEATVTTTQEGTYYKAHLDTPFYMLDGINDGVEFTVEFDGVEYSASTKKVTITRAISSVSALGGDFSGDTFDFSEYPFTLTAFDLYTSEGGEHTVRVYMGDVSTVKLTLVAEPAEGDSIMFSGSVIVDGALDMGVKELGSGTYNYTLADFSDAAPGIPAAIAGSNLGYSIEHTVEGGYEDEGAIFLNEGSTEIHLTVTTSGGDQ